jgi:hypothetical protein
VQVHLLSDDESSGFKLRHMLDYLFLQIPPEGRFINDSVFGWVLVFAKTDGTLLLIQTDLTSDPTAGDPNQLAYVISETLKAAAQQIPSLDKIFTAVLVIGGVLIALWIISVWKK